MHVYEVRPRKDKRGVDLISDALPFGRLWWRTDRRCERNRLRDAPAAVHRAVITSAKFVNLVIDLSLFSYYR